MEEKMKSKIEIGKLGKLGRVSRGNHTWWIIDELNLIIEKQNEIIDYLNSQSQPEEKSDDDNNWYCSKCGEPADKGEHICDEDYKKKVKDTPEEWEEKQRNLIEKAQEKYFDFRRREQLLGEDVEIYKNTREYVEKELVEDIINFTKQLLEEKEREVLRGLLDDHKELSKLTTK